MIASNGEYTHMIFHSICSYEISDNARCIFLLHLQ
uniref:Uncharacterized protein n=1 Tax=Arundo donax TaxID=35708 RepID=A0A0A8ZMT2_ARUDO